MNKERRKAIGAADRKLVELLERANDLAAEFEDIIVNLEELRDEEQEGFDNLPESLQGTEKGEKMVESITNLDDAVSSLRELVDALDASIIESARDSLSCASE